MKKLTKLFLVLALSSSALAHTAVTSIQPGAHQTVTVPKVVSMSFNEAIPLKFATFKVFPLPAGDKLSLNRAAAALTKTALLDRADADRRADTWAGGSGDATGVRVPLKPDLKAGAYALVWRFLSDDGHVVTGQSVFYVR